MNRPVVVLSNNDGCIVARSNEIKKLGVPMGIPIFKVDKLLKKHNTAICSSNYPLYGDMSQRVMEILKHFTCNLEIYSIDEAFLQLETLTYHSYVKLATHIRNRLLQGIGIPVSIGVAPTKTLSKIANHHAKKHLTTGIYCYQASTINTLLNQISIEEVWGIATRMGKKLRQIGIQTALDLKQANPHSIRNLFGVVHQRMVFELNEMVCLFLEKPAPRKNIMCSRSFPVPLTQLEELNEALAFFTARACYKLRAQHSLAKGIVIFLATNRFNKTLPFYRNSFTFILDTPTQDTGILTLHAKKCLKLIYKPGYAYKRTGILLIDLIEKQSYQQLSFLEPSIPETRYPLMQTIDAINQKFGKHSIYFAAEGIHKPWITRCAHRSSRFTTNWNELPVVS